MNEKIFFTEELIKAIKSIRNNNNNKYMRKAEK